ncbi:MAG: mechanosensitive ion channel family protein [Gemmatimonadales bacterium]
MSGNDMIDSGRSVLRVLLLLTALAPSEAAAQQSDSAGQEPGQEPAAQEPAAREPTAGRLDAERPDRDQPFGPVDSASVQFDGNVLFAVRGIPGFPAHERARDIADRLKTIARNRTVDLSSLRTEEAELGTQILAGETPVVLVTDLDAQLVGVPDRSALADLYLSHIREVVDEYRADRETGALLFRALYAIGATLALALALLALRWLFRKSLAIERLYGVKVGDLSVKSAQLVRADQIRRLIQSSLRAGFGFATLILIYVYLNGVLGLFPWTRGIARDLLRYVLDPLQTILLGFIGYLPNLLFILILAIVTRLLLKGLKIFLASVAAGRVHLSGFDPDWAWPTYRLVRVLVLAFFVVVAYPYIPGSGSAAFKGVSIFLGVVFSLGSSSVIGNLIAGYSMTYRRTFKVGDRVRIAEVVGDVTEIRLLVTHLRSPKNEEIVVPNSLIIGSNVVNYSSIARKEGLILHTTVGIGYEVPWRKVEAMLVEAAGRTEGLLEEPAPFVLQKALADFCVTYELNAYCQDPGRMYSLYTELHRSIQDVFNEYGVQIMTPAYEADPVEPKIVPKEQWFEAPARAMRSDGGEPEPPVEIGSQEAVRMSAGHPAEAARPEAAGT